MCAQACICICVSEAVDAERVWGCFFLFVFVGLVFFVFVFCLFFVFFSNSQQGISCVAASAACGYLQGNLAALNNVKILQREAVP